jgi:hypothetical protein
MTYLAREGLFLSPQFIVHEGSEEWSRPDFVAIDFNNKEIQIVEVSTAYNIKALMDKVGDSDNQWFKRLMPQLVKLGVISDVSEWTPIVRLFIRQDRKNYANDRVENADMAKMVRIELLEDIAFSWQWPWEAWAQ